MSDSSRPATPQPPRISGKVFVPIFIAGIVLAIVGASLIALHIRPVTFAAREKTFPLDANLNAQCSDSSGEHSLRSTGRCRREGRLRLTVDHASPGLQHVAWAIIGEHAQEPVSVGAFGRDTSDTTALADQQPGPHVLVFVVSDRALDPKELASAIAQAPVNVPDRLVKIEQFASVNGLKGAAVRTDRIQFRVE
jgi:hypothetical protein